MTSYNKATPFKKHLGGFQNLNFQIYRLTPRLRHYHFNSCFQIHCFKSKYKGLTVTYSYLDIHTLTRTHMDGHTLIAQTDRQTNPSYGCYKKNNYVHE